MTFTVAPSSGAGVCTVLHPDVVHWYVSYAAPGTCVIDADQAGNANYAPASQVKQSITVKRAQTITFGELRPSTRTTTQSPFTVTATASSGLAVTFTTSPSAVCTAGGTNGRTIALHAAGSCTISANQAGSATYLPAPTVSRSLCVYRPRTLAACAMPTGSSIGVQASVPSAGTLTASATTTAATAAVAARTSSRSARAITYGTVKLRVRHAGPVHVTIRPSPTGRRLLAQAHRLRLSVAITFAPARGRRMTRHLVVTVVATQ